MTDFRHRHLSLNTAIYFVIASMVGTGVFTSLGYQLLDIKSIFSLLMLWLIGGVISLFGALSYAELVTIYSKSGGEYYLLTKIIHPSIGFVAGVISATVGFAAPAVIAAMAMGNYFSPIFPSINVTIAAFIVISLTNLIHATNLNVGKAYQDLFTIIKIGLIFIFIVSGLFFVEHQNIKILPQLSDMKTIFSPEFAVNLVWVSYAYAGWNSSVYVAGEIKEPKKNIFKSILYGTFVVSVLYLLLNYVFLLVTPTSEMIGEVEIGYISAKYIFGERFSSIISFIIGFLLLSTVSSYVYIGPRVIQAIGKDYDVLNILSKTNAQGIPVYGYLFQYVISLIFIITSSFEQVVLYTGITLISTTTLTVISLIYLRIKNPELNRPYKVWGYPWTSVIFIVLNIWILIYTFKLQTFESLVGLGLMVMGFVIYIIIERVKIYES